MLEIDKGFIKRTNKFFLFTVGVTTAIIFIFYILGLVIDDFSDFPKASINNEHKFKLVGLFTYFFNNGFILPFIMLILSIIPIPYLYYLNTLSTVFSLGMLIGIHFAYNFMDGIKLFLGFLPHLLIEIYSLSLMLSILYVINKVIINKLMNVFRKETIKTISMHHAVIEGIKKYIKYFLPIVLIAAIIETYISPLWYYFLLSLF
ncbi:stage II sporulation protein M [Staphylococcus ureilyticus]|uniref:stage II sporulation protein M n=1 Tax=Staphylococcus ureilyticus TaxID=94138 RepID=UPI0021D0D6EE|nr:stage II sporulation protein M [Staphylococcus ureilyticus]UXS59929.1 stage II sporulation protein M [Staphylococcus ureilyticus]